MDRKIQPDFEFVQDNNFNIADDLADKNNFIKNVLRNSEALKERPLILTDMDQVIVRIDQKWALQFALKYPEYFEEKGYSKEDILNKFIDPQAISDRTDYYVNDFLGIDKKSSYYSKFFEIYTNGDFYSDLELTSFGEMIKEVSNKGVAEVYILSHCKNKNDSDSKMRFIEKNLPNVGYELIPENTLKSEAIKKSKFNLERFSIFVDDRLDIIEDVFCHTKCFGKEFIFPEYGYNKNYDYLVEPLNKNMCKLTRYDLTF